MNLNGKNVVIYGAGLSGLSAYELVKSHGARVVIYDDKDGVPHATNSVSVFDRADIIILSPGIASGKDFLLDAKLQGKTVISELELASNLCSGQQIAVTGTNGKTTTTMLIDYIFKCAKKTSHAVGNIGVAFSAVADQMDAMDIAVIEASSFQLESAVSFSPDIAVLLNITPDHLERHGTMKKYISAKANIFLHQTECDKIVYNADDRYIAELVPLMVAKKIPFSLSEPQNGAYLSSGFICFNGIPVVETVDIDFKGRELENALAAVAVAMSEGISAYTVAFALTTFERPDFRRNEIANINGVAVFNDSKATNIYSTISAVEGMDGDTSLILGGAIRREDFDEFFKLVDKKVKNIVVVGENKNKILECAKSANFLNIEVANNLTEAVLKGIESANKNNCKNLLFSPASKSFDSYKNFEERGRDFSAIVKKISK
ncbi:MAG: UDP-N-acetylmuramoyl-L-alanine--D-glutamate ligase [Clostridia bacterium]